MLVFDYADRWKVSSKDLFSDDLMKIALQWTSREKLLTSPKVLIFYEKAFIFHETIVVVGSLSYEIERKVNKLELKFWLMNCDITFPNHT